jgi:hypothetical protein
MSRTRLESVALVWHVFQMLISTYVALFVTHPVGDTWLLLLLFAAGFWLAGLLRTPTPVILLLTAIYWATLAIEFHGPRYSWWASMGVAIHVPIWPEPRVLIDVLAAATAALFTVAWRKRRLTIAAQPDR